MSSNPSRRHFFLKTSISKLLGLNIIALSDYYKESSEGKTDSGEWIIDIDKIKIPISQNQINIEKYYLLSNC